MFEKLTPRMERVLRLAQHIANDYAQEYVGTEHLLLAILKDGTGQATDILAALGVDFASAKGAVDRLIRDRMADTWVFGRLPGTPHFRNVMEKAIEEARQLESRVVCAEHMLMALAREEGSVASAALSSLGVGPAAIRAEIVRRLEAPGQNLCGTDTAAG